MNNFKIKSYCKINLTLRVLKKLKTNYHNIRSIITFCNIHDVITISKINSSKDIINFSGKFNKGISKKFNTITKTLNLLRKIKVLKNFAFKINIKKNIPHGSGLGGGSSNAASLLNILNKKIKLNISKRLMIKLAKEIGFDVPISLERKNTFLTGKKNEILRIKQKFKLNLLIVYQTLICSTKKIYKNNKKILFFSQKPLPNLKNNKKLINFLKSEQNDLQKTVVKFYPRVKTIIKFIELQKGCYFSRITGSGSACIGIFSNMKNAIYAQKMVKLKYPKYWSAVSKTI